MDSAAVDLVMHNQFADNAQTSVLVARPEVLLRAWKTLCGLLRVGVPPLCRILERLPSHGGRLGHEIRYFYSTCARWANPRVRRAGRLPAPWRQRHSRALPE